MEIDVKIIRQGQENNCFFFIPFLTGHYVISYRFNSKIFTKANVKQNRFSNQRKIMYVKSLNAVTLLDNYYSFRILFHYDFKKISLNFSWN